MKRTVFFILFLICFIGGILIENTSLRNSPVYKNADRLLQRKLERKEEVQKHILQHEDLIALIDYFDIKSEVYKEMQTAHLSIFAYKHKCLTFWSDNFIQPFNFPTSGNFSKLILYNHKGWFQVISLRKGEYEIYCYYQIYVQYPFNNEYFVDAFNEDLKLDRVNFAGHGPVPKKDISGYEIHHEVPPIEQSTYTSHIFRQRIELVYFFAFVFFVLFAYLSARKNNIFNAGNFVMLCALYSGVFNLLAFFNVLLRHKVYTKLFSPELAAFNQLIPSLGHSILLSFAILCFLVFIHQFVGTKNFQFSKKWPILIMASALIWMVNILIFFFVLPSYILNSQINYDFKSLTNVNQYTLLGMFNVFNMFLYIVLIIRIMSNLCKHHLNKMVFMSIHTLSLLVAGFWAYFINESNGFLLICFSLYSLLIPLFIFFPQRLMFKHIMWAAMFSSLLLAVQFEQLNSFKEKEHRKLFANKLIAKEDIESEIKLLNIEKELVQSAVFDSFYYYRQSDYGELELNYKFTFFNDFIKNFDVDFMRYDSSGIDITPNKLTYEYVNSLYNKSTNKSITNYFLYIKDLHYLGGYLAKYEICPADKNLGYVFLMMTPKVKSDLYNLDYFFSKMNYNSLAENQYSYAIYQKNELIKGLGAYPFKLSDNIRYASLDDVSFFEQNGYSQLFKKIDDDTFIIVSLKAFTWNKIFTVFTFILLYFVGILIAVLLFVYILIFFIGIFTYNPFFMKLYASVTKYLRVININKLYLETKIRLSFVIMSILICSVVIYFTVQNVNKSFREKQNELLDKKMQQIVSEIELGYQKKDERPIQTLIKHLANTYEVDINMYFKDGTLYQTANNRIYYEGWFSPYIHPVAHYELIQNKQYSTKQVEKIGLLEYQSYYNAIFDENRNLIGYIHLPYFSKSLDLKKEFSDYLGSLLNMSTLLLMISLLMASYIGRSLVRPLNLMIESLTKIKVGGQNQSIDWMRNDEIGQLVEQYNVMLAQLEISTEKLAQSEREGAWKEMAKQVAHEIKNPLTPMKLHLQHLLMSLNSNDAQLKEKVANISRILIEQIDHLSLMAEEFSSFAKMPLAVLETCNVNELLNSSIVLFNSQHNLDIDFKPGKDAVYVYVDKHQILRVINNILKNALQAARDNEICRVEIGLKIEDGKVVIWFTDNGKGIENELKDKIFQPNFSTKNSGMGLGLAICRKILEQVKGEITFSSDTNKGTTFYVSLPIVNPA